MTREEKQLVFVDLCGRLPYNVVVQISYSEATVNGRNTVYEDKMLDFDILETYSNVKPYLRPMSSMTDEEFEKLTIYTELQYEQLDLKDWSNGYKTLEFYLSEIPHYCVIKVFDWLNTYNFDYRGLLEQGLALEAPKDMYN